MSKLREVETTLSELLERREKDVAKRREHLDPTPIAPPIGWQKPRHIIDDIREMVRGELSRRAADGGYDSFEEAEDFDVDDEYDPTTPWEQYFEPTPIGVLRERQAQEQAASNSPAEPAGASPSTPAGNPAGKHASATSGSPIPPEGPSNNPAPQSSSSSNPGPAPTPKA